MDNHQAGPRKRPRGKQVDYRDAYPSGNSIPSCEHQLQTLARLTRPNQSNAVSISNVILCHQSFAFVFSTLRREIVSYVDIGDVGIGCVNSDLYTGFKTRISTSTIADLYRILIDWCALGVHSPVSINKCHCPSLPPHGCPPSSYYKARAMVDNELDKHMGRIFDFGVDGMCAGIVGHKLTTSLARRICSWHQTPHDDVDDLNEICHSTLKSRVNIIGHKSTLHRWMMTHFYEARSRRVRRVIGPKCLALTRVCLTLLREYKFVEFMSQHEYRYTITLGDGFRRCSFDCGTTVWIETFLYAPRSFSWELLGPTTIRHIGRPSYCSGCSEVSDSSEGSGRPVSSYSSDSEVSDSTEGGEHTAR